MRYILITFLGVFTWLSTAFSQDLVFPINIHDGQLVETCSGFFTDSGGDNHNSYGNNEDFSVTFRSDSDEQTPYIKVHFIFFELEEGDYLYIYDGEDASAPLLHQASGQQLNNVEIWASGAALHFRFTSSPSNAGLGWWAEISCFSLCNAFYADVTTDSDTFDFCPDVQSVSFFATAGYFGGAPQGDGSGYVFEWNFEGEIQQGATVTRAYNAPGAYPFRLSVTDPLNNCTADTLKTVRLATIPTFDATLASADTVCARETFTLIGGALPVTWTGFPTVVDTVAFITQGQEFSSVLEFDVFPQEDQLTVREDFDRVCVNIEHVDFGHVAFELECPNGSSVLLKDVGLGGAHLGEPVVLRDDIAGIGYEYCFSTLPQLGAMHETSFQFHEYIDQSGDFYFNQPYMPAGNYTPDESFEALVGCPLNGSWRLRVTDEITGTSGHVTGWSLFFNDRFYPDSLIFTPEIIDEQWYDGNNNAITGNPASKSEEDEGEYFYTYRVTDNFGCQWDTVVRVYVQPLPRAEILSDLEIPVCEGDSTLFSVVPLNVGDELDWIYQWMVDGAELEGRITDTLMAKEPRNYMVRVTDTITGCFEFFDLTLSTQNCDLTIPNVFTPNNDGINDYFEIINLEHYPGSTIVIYNRHGRKVFEHNDYYGNWWGGGNQPDGTYYYILTYIRQGERKQTQGVITIVR